MPDVTTETTTVTLKAAGLPGGGACAYAPANTVNTGDRVIVSSQSKGDRVCVLGQKFGTIAHPFSGAIDVFAYKAV